MAKSKKISINKRKRNSKIPIIEQPYEPKRIVFNFSFISKKYGFDKLITKSEHSTLLKKIEMLSSETLISVMSRPRRNTIEKISEEQVNLNVDSDFRSIVDKYCLDGFWVFRFNGQHSRIIGKIRKNVFYILAIDLHLDLYKH